MEKIFIGSDHGGFDLKKVLVDYVKGLGYDVIDVGPLSYDKNDDYPDYASKLCKNVLSSKGRGILICRT